MAITGSPTATKLNTGIRGKRGDRAKRKLTHYNQFKDVSSEKGCPSLAVYPIERYLTGWQERTFENMYGGNEQRLVFTVIDAVSGKGKVNNRTGPRRHHQAQSLHRDGGTCSIVPSFATEVLERAKRIRKSERKKQERKGFSVSIGEDGCTNVSVRGHLSRYGYTAKNKHTAKSPVSQVGTAVDDTNTVSNNPDEWVLVRIILEGPKRTKLKTATCIVRNPNKRLRKSIAILRVRNEAEARAMLLKIHGI